MEYQKWFCEKCGAKGEVEYKDVDGVMAVVNAIEDDHQLHSDQCTQPITKIRIVNDAA